MAREVLISGAGIAGQVLAFWLHRHGHRPILIERAADIRRTGGHALDVAGIAAEVFERMDLWQAAQERAVHRDRLVLAGPSGRPLAMSRLTPSIAGRHLEIQRDELVTLLSEATPEVERIVGDSITTLQQTADGVEVQTEQGVNRTVDLVIGADGLHSRVRRLTFGPEDRFRNDLGAHLTVFSFANHAGLDPDEVVGHIEPGRAAFSYPIGDGSRARSILLFRTGGPIARDQQYAAVREVFDGLGERLPFRLSDIETADDFYLDSISQIVMDSWSRGRVSLVGDAGYSPGPAVGGGTGLAILGGYVLAQQIAATQEPEQAFARYEEAMAPAVRQSRRIGPASLRQLVPAGALGARAMPHLMRTLTRLPPAVMRRLFALQGADRADLDTFTARGPDSDSQRVG